MAYHLEAISSILYVGLGCLIASSVALSTDTGSEGNAGNVGGSTLNNGE